MKINGLDTIGPDQVILIFPTCTDATRVMDFLQDNNPHLEIYRRLDHLYVMEKQDKDVLRKP